MLEAPARLIESGEKVALLAMIDTYPHPRLWPAPAWLGVMVQRTKRHARIGAGISSAAAARQTIPIARKIIKSLCQQHGNPVITASSAATDRPIRLREFQRMWALAAADHQPRPVNHTARFLKAALYNHYPGNPGRVWAKLGQQLDVHRVACGHVESLTTHVDETAKWLSRCLGNCDHLNV